MSFTYETTDCRVRVVEYLTVYLALYGSRLAKLGIALPFPIYLASAYSAFSGR